MNIENYNYNLQNEMLSTIKEWQNLAKHLQSENTALRDDKVRLIKLCENLADPAWSKDDLCSMYQQAIEERNELERENAAFRDALKTALGIEALDEENLNELIERCRKIINAQN